MTERPLLQTKSAERIAFEMYLRSGRRLSPAQVEVKFNPWHDPEDGRFTFANDGTFHGGGGSFGGGGASGSWEPRAAPPSPKKAVVTKPQHQAIAAPPKKAATAKPVSKPAAAPAPKHEQNRHINANGYDFEVDSLDRNQRTRGEVYNHRPETRSKRLQRQAGGADRRTSDDGGHYIAARFGGPRAAFNHFAQDASFNRGRYRTIENEWAKDKAAGHRVYVDIASHYHGASKRPYSLTVVWYVDGHKWSKSFNNEKAK